MVPLGVLFRSPSIAREHPVDVICFSSSTPDAAPASFVTMICKFTGVDPSLSSIKAKAPPPATRPVFTHPATTHVSRTSSSQFSEESPCSASEPPFCTTSHILVLLNSLEYFSFPIVLENSAACCGPESEAEDASSPPPPRVRAPTLSSILSIEVDFFLPPSYSSTSNNPFSFSIFATTTTTASRPSTVVSGPTKELKTDQSADFDSSLSSHQNAERSAAMPARATSLHHFSDSLPSRDPAIKPESEAWSLSLIDRSIDRSPRSKEWVPNPKTGFLHPTQRSPSLAILQQFFSNSAIGRSGFPYTRKTHLMCTLIWRPFSPL